MKIGPVEAEFHADGRTDGRTDTMKLIVCLRIFANAPETRYVVSLFSPADETENCPETSVMKHQPMPRNVLEERRLQVHRGVKARNIPRFEMCERKHA